LVKFRASSFEEDGNWVDELATIVFSCFVDHTSNFDL